MSAQASYMFDGCHPHIITAADYNSMNPGKSYSDDFCNRHSELYKYFSDSFIDDSKSNVLLLNAISNVAAWCSKTDDSRYFMGVVDAINSGVLSDFEAINDEVDAVSKYYEHKQNQGWFADTHRIVGTPNLGKSGYLPDF